MLSLLCVPDSFMQTDSKVKFRGEKKFPSDRECGMGIVFHSIHCNLQVRARLQAGTTPAVANKSRQDLCKDELQLCWRTPI